MNFSLIPMPAAEELTQGYTPSAGGNRMTAVLYLLVLLFMFQLPPDGRSAELPRDSTQAASLAQASCADCIQTPRSSDHTKD